MRSFLLLSALSFLSPAAQAGEDPKSLRYDGKSLAEWLAGLQSADESQRKKASDALTEMGRQNRDSVPAIVDQLLETTADSDDDLLRRIESYGPMLYEIGAPVANALHPHLWNPKSDKKFRALLFVAILGGKAKPALPGVIETIEKDSDPKHFRAAMLVADRCSDPSLLPVLVRLLDDRADERSSAAAGILKRKEYPPDSYLPILKNWLRGKDKERRLRAFDLLFQLAGEATPVMDELITVLQGTESFDRFGAAVVLGRIGPAAKKAIPALEELLTDKNDKFRLHVATAMLNIADHAQAEAELLRILKEGNAGEKLDVAEVLWRHKRPAQVLLALNEILEKGDIEKRRDAVQMLRKLGPAARVSIPLLTKMLDDPDAEIKTFAIQALGRMGPEAKNAIEPLKAIDKQEIKELRFFAMMALVRIEASVRLVDQLVQHLKSKETGEVVGALRALGGMGPVAKPALPAIQEKLKDPDGYIRLHALEAEWFIARTASIRDKLLKEAKIALPIDRHDSALSLGDLFRADAAFAVDDFIGMLWKDTDNSGVAEALGWIGPAAKKAVPALTRILLASGIEPNVCSASAEALGLIGVDAKTALPALKQLLNHDDALVRIHAALALLRIDGDKSGEAVVARSLLNRKYQVVVTALEAQWLLKKDEATIASLIRELRRAILSDSEMAGNHRFMAARALGRIGPAAKAALPDLNDLRYDEDPTLRRHVQEAIAKIEAQK